MNGFGLYIAFLIPPLLLGLGVQHWLKKTVQKNSQIAVASGLSGADVARQILDRNGLQAVPVERAPGGPLSDHYDPRHRAVFLSETIYDGRTIAASAIGAHEVGHAIQHASHYVPMVARSAIFPAVALASNAWMFLLILGAVLGAVGLVQLALILFAVIVLFQLVTLPVEFNASSRAKKLLLEYGFVTQQEQSGVSGVLRAAAMTYVAGALAAIAQLAYFAMAFLGNRD